MLATMNFTAFSSNPSVSHHWPQSSDPTKKRVASAPEEEFYVVAAYEYLNVDIFREGLF
jgi:hypothetical protein